MQFCVCLTDKSTELSNRYVGLCVATFVRGSQDNIVYTRQPVRERRMVNLLKVIVSHHRGVLYGWK